VNSDGHQRRADRRSFWKEYLPLMYGDHGDTDNGGLFSNSIDCGFVARVLPRGSVALVASAPIYSAIITDNHQSFSATQRLSPRETTNKSWVPSEHDNSMQEFNLHYIRPRVVYV
jgi:hypothetical protein